jgi:hypothetical protein
MLDIRLEDFPCGGCSYCVKAHKNWTPFSETMDNALPLSAFGALVLQGI